MVILKRLYIENYKLFSQKELDFSKTCLSVFDGPNGYGKTSIFDAIELLITGKISRVLECESIDGKQAYKTVFFAQNSEKDVVLKAEFEDIEKARYFVLGARVKSADVNGKIANPKSIFDKIEYYYLPNYDISIDSWNDFKKNTDEIKKIRDQEFGHQNIEQFTLFHYIRQEDRLSYLKQSEKSRANTIESLLGVSKETEKYTKIVDRRKSIDNILKQISNELESKKKRVVEFDVDIDNATQYEPLLNGEQIWDKENVFFGDSNKEKVLAQYFSELERIEFYVKYIEFHDRYFSYESFMNISEKDRIDIIHALIKMQANSVSVDIIDESFKKLKFLKQQKNIILSQEYKSLNLPQLFNVLDIPEDKSIESEIVKLGEISRNQGELQRALNNIIKIRENLHQSHVQISKDGVCPYCGYDWKSQEELENQFASTKMILQRLLTKEGELYAKQIESIKEKTEEGILVDLNLKIEELSKMDILSIYDKFGLKEKFVTAIEKAHNIFDIATSQLTSKGWKMQEDDEYLGKLYEECISIGNMIPNEYLTTNEKYAFSDTRKKYLINSEVISRLTKENINKKRKYLQEQFYKSFDKIKEEIAKLEIQNTTLVEVQDQISEYEKAVKRAIEKYKKQIIDEIEIPFFVYTSRLLQSYQGGQGVLMTNDGGSIRFTTPGKEHDVLYTMSSGQLSAVILSFSLALNKIYSGDGIKTLLIDDPIQCMDDINMISFVELLRREFSDCQIILSTHEEDFSNYVRYKFKKYGLVTQAITLKDA